MTIQKILLIIFLTFYSIQAQYNPSPNDTLTSTWINQNNATFQIYAPNADSVKLAGPDIPNILEIGKMYKETNGIWKVTIYSLEPGAYRYYFEVDGLQVIDPKNPITSESNQNTWSLIHVDGNEIMDLKNVPHGSLAEVNYYSTALNQNRRMHVYTPPGYENDTLNYPVFYLLHGAWDSDDSWSTVGCANNIIDNLIAENKIDPMIVVMPAGHTEKFWFGKPPAERDEFIADFLTDIKPMIEKKYRVKLGKENTAIAGLSMGGGHTINISIPHLEDFGYIGVFSSGIFGINGGNGFLPNMGTTWEEKNEKYLDDSKLKEELKLVWFGIGIDDFLLETSKTTVDVLRKHNFEVIYKETEGGHTWLNWRDYLIEFSQKLFN